MASARWTRWAAGAALVAAAVAVFATVDVQAAGAALDGFRDAGFAGGMLYVLLYFAATVLGVPGTILTLAAGWIYGPLVGSVIVWSGANLGALGAFLLARFVFRNAIAARLSDYPRFRAVDTAVEQAGLSTVFLVRLSPVFPFNVLNYALGLTGVSVRDYVVGSAVGMLPGTLMYVYLGSTVGSLEELLRGQTTATPASQALYWAGLLATVVVTVLVTRRARAALDERLDTAPTDAASQA